jgi:hypothetical protein
LNDRIWFLNPLLSNNDKTVQTWTSATDKREGRGQVQEVSNVNVVGERKKREEEWTLQNVYSRGYIDY